ncbi:hypothetical protein BHE74_00024015 [Ensete ventricosum]|nr:hypothetical protein BHE74_00024015 [Ensete ventricosum]RZR92843.1 hypothetical protein BHM03_00021207 [Ensete ventricosum]
MATVAGAIGRSEGQREKRYSRISAGAHRHRPSCSLCCSILFVESTCMGHRPSSLSALQRGHLSVAPAVAASPSSKSIVIRPSP